MESGRNNDVLKGGKRGEEKKRKPSDRAFEIGLMIPA